MSNEPDGWVNSIDIPIFVRIVNGKGNKKVWRGWWHDPDNNMKARVIYFPRLSVDPEFIEESKRMALQAVRLEILKFYGIDRVVTEGRNDESEA